MTSELNNTVMSFLWTRCHDDEIKKKVHRSFHAFKNKRDGFNMSSAWIHKEDPTSFWQTFLSISQHQELARIAVTIFETPANSVASERAFSYINLITTAIRNRLLAQRSTKLIYIHINQRVLDANKSFKDWVEGEDDLQLELENILVSIEEDGDNSKVFTEVEDIKINGDNEDRIDQDDDLFMEGADN